MVVTLRGYLIIRREPREWKLSIALSKTVMYYSAKHAIAWHKHKTV